MTFYHFLAILIIVTAVVVLAGMRQIGHITLKQAIIFVSYGFIGGLFWAIVYYIFSTLPFVSQFEHNFPFLYILFDVFIAEAFFIELLKDNAVHYGVESGKIPIQTVFDAVVFGALVGIGFGVVENIINIILEPNPNIYYLLQEVGLVLSNIAFGAMMGYFIGMSHFYEIGGDKTKSRIMLIAGLIIPSVLHGIPTLLEESAEHHMVPEWFEWLAVLIEAIIIIVGLALFFKWKRTMIKIHDD